ncbi:MAG: arylsulfatase [Planctomycetota bacterium]|jgi:arylsulfatase
MNRRVFLRHIGLGVVGSVAAYLSSEQNPAWSRDSRDGPNVILVMTDDQGYGELGCHGNPILKTPNLDKLYAESTRFTAFHVSPTCAPTRASLMTGRHEFRSGVTHTLFERERMSLDAVTIAQILSKAGYKTGIFGKWHLGDEEPYQPHNRGFDEVFIHGAGGIGQSYKCSCGDVPGNKYFDPVIRHNKTFVQTKGYCTDIFFTQALRWIKRHKDRHFFAYITANTPHSPHVCSPEYSKPYLDAGLDEKSAAYYGMIANIDDNIGRLVGKMDQWGLSENMLLIFMTDNGHSMRNLYNAGMRAHKGTVYEGGTRVPAFFRWPGQIKAGVDIDRLCAHIDLFPTLAELCGATIPAKVKLDGRSLAPLLRNPNAEWPDRYLFVHRGRWKRGKAKESKYIQCAVRSQRFRLVNNQELYDIESDPGETTNVIHKYPEVVAKMRKAYDQWWDEVLPAMVNEDAPYAKDNPFRVLYLKQKAEQGIPAWPAHEP